MGGYGFDLGLYSLFSDRISLKNIYAKNEGGDNTWLMKRKV
jgi:hypothetical protein